MPPDAVFEGLESLSVSVGVHNDYVATVKLDRPHKRNALDRRMQEELNRTLEAVENSEIRTLVLTGSAESGVFAAGGDVTELRDLDVLEQRKRNERPRIFENIAALSIPVIARINGDAVGGGCELAQACDIRIARKHARLGQPEISLGLIPGGGGTQRLPRLVGKGHAFKLVLSGELLDAEEARNIGLVEEVHTEETFDERVYDLAGDIATKSPTAIRFAKQAVGASSNMTLRQGIEYEAELFAELFASEDVIEGIDAFLEDRTPEFDET